MCWGGIIVHSFIHTYEQQHAFQRKEEAWLLVLVLAMEVPSDHRPYFFLQNSVSTAKNR
jgi:hypothetical protein